MFKLNSLPVFLNLTTEYCPVQRWRRQHSSDVHNFTGFFILYHTVNPDSLPNRFINLWMIFFRFSYVCCSLTMCLHLSPSPRPFFNCSLRILCSFNCYQMCSMWYHESRIKWRSKNKKTKPSEIYDVNETLCDEEKGFTYLCCTCWWVIVSNID